MTRKYWKGLDELQETPAFVESRDREFPESVTVDEFLGDESLKETSTPRRDFLKFLGFSVAAATVAACEAPVTKAIPYVNKPENVTPGMPTWYASTYYDGTDYASILVKTREGRPIYIKGNKEQGFTKGGVTSQVIASVLGLYDSARLKTAQHNGEDISWQKLDDKVQGELMKIGKAKGKVAFVSNTIISPSMQSALVDLSTAMYGPSLREDGMPELHPNFNHIQYDAVSYSGIRQANFDTFGKAMIPDYDFSKAKTVIGIGADFLDSWLLGNQYAVDYGTRRDPDGEWMSRHFQFETIMSITGSNADYRAMIKPSEQANVLAYLIGKMGGNAGGVSDKLSPAAKKVADEAVKSLKSSRRESLVVCGSNNKAVQILTNKLNETLKTYGTTITFENELNMYQSEDAKMHKLAADIIAKSSDRPDAIIFLGTNPAYNLPNGKAFGEALESYSKSKLTVSLSSYADETATKCAYIAPDHHALEAWADYNAKAGHYAIAQPTIRPLHNTASAMESVLVWAGKANRGGKDSRVAFDYISKNWELYGFPQQTEYTDFHTYWGMAVHNSAMSMTMPPVAVTFNEGAMSGLSSKLPKGGDLEVVLYQKTGIKAGEMASNPWLQELPDPISKVTWDNYITMNPTEMKKGGYVTTFDQENGLNMATVKVGNESVTLPVYPSPGQALGTIGIALGYGRGAGNEEIGNAAYRTLQYGGFELDEKGKRIPIGANVFPFMDWANNAYSTDVTGTIAKADGIFPIAATQIHHTVMGRHSIVKETTLDIYKNEDSKVYNAPHVLHTHDGPVPIKEFDLWDAHPVEHVGHRWGMTIDLNQCFGCGSCLIACQSENNVPVVGKDEVRRGREMHWLRIDRYYASDEEAAPGTRKDADTFSFGDAEIPSENPKVVHMPMLCHHCNHAPCETVCPVAATTHSLEGLNQMAYNRCIGTRYCANNCPYKVRRFNWFNYPSYKKFTEINPAQDDLGRMVLNPDVTVRTRGVMEKCSLCVQRIQAGKLVAKKELRPVMDGDVVTACQDACPSNAIIVGDWNDLKSMVRKSADDKKRAYQALEEVGVKPNIWYKVKVRNEHNAELTRLAHEERAEMEAHHASAEKEHGKKKNH
ncbi:MAG TPA: TAT-variant-translocated molybdopterin oxidoreductase [Fluviicola sp.]|nr:TAT-variant-translocated molybdopterin oxidoreductase [Fluviicola sp.]